MNYFCHISSNVGPLTHTLSPKSGHLERDAVVQYQAAQWIDIDSDNILEFRLA